MPKTEGRDSVAVILREPLRRTLSGTGAGWPPLGDREVEALTAHGVAPLLYARAQVRELRDEAMRAAAIEPLRLADLRVVLEALEARGVRALLMKGAALAYDLYERPDLRPRVDTDLLIEPGSFPAAREVFRSLGFEEQVTSGDEHGVRQCMFRRFDGHGAGHTYDVHWSVTNSPLVGDVLRFEEIDPVNVPAIGGGAWALPRVEALLLACVHRVVHHHDDDRLIWLVDIALLRATLSEDQKVRFRRLAAERRVAAICARSFTLADEWLGPAGWTVEPPQEREPAHLLLDRDLTHGTLTLANLRALPWRARLTRLWQLAFPPAAFMHRSFSNHRRAALPWLYLVRGLRGLMRSFRRVSAR